MSERIEIRGYPLKLEELVDHHDNSIVSRTLIDCEAGTVTIFAFDKGQALSEHTAPYEALVQVVDGVAEIIIDNNCHEVSAGGSIIMPADVPHAVKAPERFKMILTMIRG